MPKSTTPTSQATYRYTVGGEAYGIPHEVGDRVPEDIPEPKIKEWLRGGAIEKERKPRKSDTQRKEKKP